MAARTAPLLLALGQAPLLLPLPLPPLVPLVLLLTQVASSSSAISILHLEPEAERLLLQAQN